MGSRDFVPRHSYAVLRRDKIGKDLTFTVSGEGEEVDFLLLTGEPLNQPVVASGSFVMDTQAGIDKAMSDYQKGLLGPVFDHKLGDEEWAKAVESHWDNINRRSF